MGRKSGTEKWLLFLLFLFGGGGFLAAQPERVTLEPRDLTSPAALLGCPSRAIGFDDFNMASFAYPTAAGKVSLLYRDGRLAVDLDGNGTIDPAETRGYVRWFFFKVKANLCGQERECPFFIQHLDRDGVVLTGATVMEGRFRGHLVRVFDGDMDGKYTDREKDRLALSPPEREVPVALNRSIFAQHQGQPLAGYFPLGEKLFQPQVQAGGRAVVFTPYRGRLAHLELALDPVVKRAQVVLTHKGGLLTRVVQAGERAPFLPGSYRIDRVTLSLAPNKKAKKKIGLLGLLLGRKDGVDWVLSGEGGGKPVATRLAPGKNRFRLGPPFRLDFALHRRQDMLRLDDPVLVGQAGETYRAETLGGESTLEWFLLSRGERIRLGSLEYG